jgi:hypothetical protein
MFAPRCRPGSITGSNCPRVIEWIAAIVCHGITLSQLISGCTAPDLQLVLACEMGRKAICFLATFSMPFGFRCEARSPNHTAIDRCRRAHALRLPIFDTAPSNEGRAWHRPFPPIWCWRVERNPMRPTAAAQIAASLFQRSDWRTRRAWRAIGFVIEAPNLGLNSHSSLLCKRRHDSRSHYAETRH